MALLDSTKVARYPIPHEPGEWMDLRPLTAGDIRRRKFERGSGQTTFDIYADAIVAWSYGEPVTPENIARLDMKTFAWLQETATEASGLRDDDEKNALSASSTPSTARGEALSLTSSGT